MQVKTILNRVQKFKSFVYTTVRWVWSDEAPVRVCSAVGHQGISGLCAAPRRSQITGVTRSLGSQDHWGQVLFHALNSGTLLRKPFLAALICESVAHGPTTTN